MIRGDSDEKAEDGQIHPLISTDGEESDNEHAVNPNEKVKESDSIQRALVDQYRQAKLLQNFSMINYTGFVKIVKKHDKTFPEYKGTYKETIKESNVCNEGIEVTELIDRMEKAYADWFCDGNIREAQAQMLPKRGDGLQMDWSQFR
jgi:SPX domain protein involved in polyphosphate accumulation